MSTAHTEAASSTAAPPKAAAPRAHSGRRPAQLWHYLGLAFIIFWGLAPFYWMVVTALRDSDHTFDTTPWPTHVTLDNFADALATDKGNDFVGAIVNSLLISLATTGLAVAVGVFTAALVTPLFQLFGDLEWIGTYRAMIIPNISFALPLTVYTLVSFFRQLPWELEEAARVDGASRGQAFRLVLLPLAAPALFTTAIIAFITTWNEFMLARQLSNRATEPVTVAIARFSGPSAFEYPYAATMAAGALVTIPLIVMVLIFQHRIVSGLTAGGVKA